jgi:hypothetical protein
MDALKAGVDKSKINDIILVGGASRIPCVQALVKELLGKEPSKSVNPDEAVALGAAVQGAIIAGDVTDIVLMDVTPLSLGVEVNGGMVDVLIPKNTTIPVEKKSIYTTAQSNQQEVTIHILQGERTLAKDNKSIGMFNLDGILPAPAHVPQIEVSFDLDVNGILSVKAKDIGTGKEQKITITQSSNLDQSEIDRMIKEAEEYAEADKEAKEYILMKNEIEMLCDGAESSIEMAKDKEIADAESKYEQAKNKYDSDRKYFERLIADKEKARMVKQIAPALITAIGTEITEIINKIDALKQPDIDPVTKVKKDLTDLITEKDIKVREEDEKIATAKKTKETELAKIDAEIKRRNDAIAEPTAASLLTQLSEAQKKLSFAKTNRILNRNSNGWDPDLSKGLITVATAATPGVSVMSVEEATDEKAKKEKELKLVGKPDRYDEHAKSVCEIVLRVIADKEAIEARLANAAGAEPAVCDARYADGGALRMSPIYMKVLQVLAGEDITMLSRKDDLKKWTDALPPEAVFRLLGPPVNTILPFNNAAFGAPAVTMAEGIGRAEIELVRKKLLTDAQTGMAGAIDLPTRNRIKALESIPFDSVLAASLAVLTNPPNPQNDYLNTLLRRVYAYRDIADLTEKIKPLTTATTPPLTDATFKAYAIEIDRRRKLLLDAI